MVLCFVGRMFISDQLQDQGLRQKRICESQFAGLGDLNLASPTISNRHQIEKRILDESLRAHGRVPARVGSVSIRFHAYHRVARHDGAYHHRKGAAVTTLVNPTQISRFLEVHDDDAARNGIKLVIGFDFHEYVSITQATPREFQTFPHFRPDRSPIKSCEGYWIMGLDKNNGVAVLQAQRLYELSQSNFAEHLESLRAVYADPSAQAHPQDHCTCAAPSARKMIGKVAYHGDYWIRRDFRGQGISKIITRTAQSLTFAMWAPDFLCGLVAPWTLNKSFIVQGGYVHQEAGGSILKLIEDNIVADEWLIWRTGEELRSQFGHQDTTKLIVAPSFPSI